MYTAMAKQHYTKVFFTKNVPLQNKAVLERNKTKQNLENILNYLKNYEDNFPQIQFSPTVSQQPQSRHT